MGRLQSHVLNTCIEPIAGGNIGTGAKLAKFALDHTGAMRCCLETIYAAHEAETMNSGSSAFHHSHETSASAVAPGAFNTGRLPCRDCARIWERDKGWWAIGRREREERFKRGHELSRERIAAAQKRGASKRSVMNQQARERAK